MSPTFSRIGGAEPSTVTFKLATVTQTRNSSAMHQELMVISDPDSSLANAAVLNAVPASTAWGLVVRPVAGTISSVGGVVTIAGNSTVVQGTSPWTIAGNSTVDSLAAFGAGLVSSVALTGGSSGLRVRPVWSSSNADQPVSAVVASGNSSVVVTSGNSSVVITSGNSSVTVSGFAAAFVSTAVLAGNSSALNVRMVWSSTAVDQTVRAVLSSTAADNNVAVSSVSGVVTVTPNSTAWVKNAGLSVDSSNYLNVNASVVMSTTVQVSSVGGVVTVTPNSTAWVKNAGFAVDSSNALIVAGAFSAQFSSTKADNLVTVYQSSAAELRATALIESGNSSVTVSAFAAGLLSTNLAALNSSALNVRIVGHGSSGANFPVVVSGNSTVMQGTSPWTIAGNSTVDVLAGFGAGLVSSAALTGNSSGLRVRPVWSSTNADQPVSAVIASGNSSVTITGGNSTTLPNFGAMQSTVAPSSNSSALMVRQIVDLPLTAVSTHACASTLFVINSTVAGAKCKVFAYSIMTTNAGPTRVAFYAGSTMAWAMRFAAVSSAISGANLSVTPPAYLFASDAGSSMTLRFSGSTIAGWTVSVSYFMGP